MNKNKIEEELERAQQRLNRLKQRMAKEKKCVSSQRRNDETRSKILVGAAILSLINKGQNEPLNATVAGLVWKILQHYQNQSVCDFVKKEIPYIADKGFKPDLKLPKPKSKPS